MVQMGVDRAGLYTYPFVENTVFRLGVRDADRGSSRGRGADPSRNIRSVRERPAEHRAHAAPHRR